jgi:hypothetical protein
MAAELKELTIHEPKGCKKDMLDEKGICRDEVCPEHGLWSEHQKKIEERLLRVRREMVIEAQCILTEIYGEEAPKVVIVPMGKCIYMHEEDLVKGRKWFLSETLKRTVNADKNSWKLIDHLVKIEMEAE